MYNRYAHSPFLRVSVAEIYPFSFSNAPASQEIRDKYNQLASEYGNDYVYNYLNKIDPKSAQTLHPNQLSRIIRAIEIFETTGIRKSEQENEINKDYTVSRICLTLEGLFPDCKK